MDPSPPRPSRRTLVAIAGAAAVPPAGGLMGPIPGRPASHLGPKMEIDLAGRTLATLAAGYDTLGPARVAATVATTERTMLRIAEGRLPAPLRDGAMAVHARLLVMSAECANALGRHDDATRRAEAAISLATEIKDAPTVAHAWAVIAIARRCAGRIPGALVAAHRAGAHAGASPAAVMALLDEALIGAASPHGVDAHAVYDCVTAAEEAHGRLGEDRWGHPGYWLGTAHPANVKIYGAAALAGVGMYGEAAPRLAEAADILAGCGAAEGQEMVRCHLERAQIAEAVGERDTALKYAAAAVELAAPRPAAWVARIVGELDRASEGAFAALAEQTTAWGFPSHA